MKRFLTWQAALPYVLVIGGLIGLLASFMLTYDKIQLLQNPAYQPGCNLNPVISCGSVMKAEQATFLGVPNTIFGLIAFTGLVTFGLVLLSGTALKRWLWLGAQVLATAGVVFMHYLFFQSIFRIHAICPWCFVVWMVTIPIFFGITLHNLRAYHLRADRSRLTAKVARFIDAHAADILALWYVLIFGLLLTQFWYYWKTLL